MDDEAFARMLQQQLLDEERMLMEQQQNAGPGPSYQYESNEPRMQHPPPPQQQYNAATPYGTVPNHQGYSSSQTAHQAQGVGHQGNYGHHEDADLALARRMQEMEARGMYSDQPYNHVPEAVRRGPEGDSRGVYNDQQYRSAHSEVQHMPSQGGYNSQQFNPAPQNQQNRPSPRDSFNEQPYRPSAHAQYNEQQYRPAAQPSHTAGGGMQRQLSQEEKDERLARMLAESGQSFSDLNLIDDTQQAPYHEPQPVQQSVGSIPSGPPPGQNLNAPPQVQNTCAQQRPAPFVPPQPPVSRPNQNSYTPDGRLPPQYADMGRPQESNRSAEIRLDSSSQSFTPPTPSFPAHPSNTRPSGPNAQASRRPARPTPPSRHMDPVPLNNGPLQPPPSRKPPQQGPVPRNSNQNPMRPPDYSNIPPQMQQMDNVLLDVPAKKEKTKKKGLLGRLGRKGGKESDSGAKPAKEETSPGKGDKSRKLFGGRSRSNAGAKGPPEMLDTNPPAAAQPGANLPDGGDNDVVRFKIPDPVPRPADTIGAPKGPLPYSLSVSRDAPEPPEAKVGKKPQLSLSRSTATCAACNQTAQNPINALGKKYHAECFRCITCQQPIDPNGSFAFMDVGEDKQPMHRRCYAEIFGIKCCVCGQSIPAGPDGKVSFVKHPFFDTEQMCPHHARNMTRRCTGCHRFEPETEPFADLNDVGRCVCMSCCRSVVVDSNDAQPLWGGVVEFFEKKLNMPIWKDFREVPILVVGYNALNDQMNNTANVHGGASQIMTRGLCLTEHESGRRFRMNRMKFDRNQQSFVACDAEERGFTFFQVPDASKSNPDASVTAILCLSGLPKDLAASVLAHEATHAWIKLHPRFDFERPIPPQVEEGCAQLIALLFLNEGLASPMPLEDNDGSGPSDEKLRQYFKFSIETDDHEIYGTGYRRAAMAYSKIGIEALMSHVVLYQEFPEV